MLSALVFAISVLAPAQDYGTLKIDRVRGPEHDTGYALVTYRNTTPRTFRAAVTIRCNALDSAGRKVATNARSFFVHDVGPIAPGFEGTREIPVRLNGAPFASMQCLVESAR